MSPALGGGFFTTEPPGETPTFLLSGQSAQPVSSDGDGATTQGEFFTKGGCRRRTVSALKMLGSHDSETLPPAAEQEAQGHVSATFTPPERTAAPPAPHPHRALPRNDPQPCHSLHPRCPSGPCFPTPTPSENSPSILSAQSLSPHPTPSHIQPEAESTSSTFKVPRIRPLCTTTLGQSVITTYLVQQKSPAGRPPPEVTPGLKILPGSRVPQNKIQSHSSFFFF